jgi:hypothetical protein
LGELYVDKQNSKISDAQYTSILNIRDELKKLSKGDDYRRYKLSTFYLIRSLIEQCLKYWLSTYHKTSYNKCKHNGDAVLGDMINLINKRLDNHNDIFFDKTINIRFSEFFGNSTTKTSLDCLVHHPYLLSDDIDVLHGYTSGKLFQILNYILTYVDSNEEQ